MKKYIGTKMVEAAPSTRGEFWESVDYPVEARKDDPNQEGYMVIYEDGYVSWSPKETFEKAYRETDEMTFGLAIEEMKKGCKVARKGWNGKKQYIELAENISYTNARKEIVNAEHKAIGNRAIAFVGTSGVQLGWLASQADMLAEDWFVIE